MDRRTRSNTADSPKLVVGIQADASRCISQVSIDRDGNEIYCSERVVEVKKHRITEDVLTRDLRW